MNSGKGRRARLRASGRRPQNLGEGVSGAWCPFQLEQVWAARGRASPWKQRPTCPWLTQDPPPSQLDAWWASPRTSTSSPIKREHLLPPRVQPGLAGLPGLTLSCQPTPADTWARPPWQSGWLSWVPSTVTVSTGSLLPEAARTPAHPHFSGALSVSLRPRLWHFRHCCAARGQRTY